MPKRVTIDRAGRIVLPKPIRDRYGLHAGSNLQIGQEGERIVLEPVPEEAVITDRKGILIISSELTGEPIDHRSLREKRLEQWIGEKT